MSRKGEYVLIYVSDAMCIYGLTIMSNKSLLSQI